jgi:hypothetical protein
VIIFLQTSLDSYYQDLYTVSVRQRDLTNNNESETNMILRDLDQLINKIELTCFSIQVEFEFFEQMTDEQRAECLIRLQAANLLMQEVIAIDLKTPVSQVA